MTGGQAGSWYSFVAATTGESTATVVIQPPSEDAYDYLTMRMRSAGWRDVRRQDWETMACPAGDGALHLVGPAIRCLDIGTTHIYTASPLDMSPMWISAARERPGAVALVPPGTFSAGDDPATTGQRISELADRHELLAALVPVRFTRQTGSTHSPAPAYR